MTQDTSWLDDMPEIYDRCLGPALFAPFASRLAAVVAAHAPRTVLELAAGTGILTAELVRQLPDAQLTATDLNPAMVSWASQRCAGPKWQAADANELRFADSSFDLLACQFGVMFFPDKVKAFAEARRVLRPGGVFIFAVWDAVDTSPFPAALVAALAEAIPHDPPDFVVRIPHGYHDPDQIRLDLAGGGLEVDGIDRLVLSGAAPSARVVAEGFCYGTPLRFALQQHGDLVALTQAVAEQLTRRLGGGPVEGALTAYIVSARRP